MLVFYFLQGEDFPCLAAADMNGNGALQSLLDPRYLLSYQFLDGPAPPDPFEDCGEDPDGDDVLGC